MQNHQNTNAVVSRQQSQLVVLALLPLLALWIGCENSKPPASGIITVSSQPKGRELSNMFSDDAESNREDDGSLQGVEFVDTDGNKVALADFIEKKNVLLVFTRGFSGSLCPFCTTQSSRLIANYDAFVERNTEVLLVFPGAKDQISSFRQASLELTDATSFPFPVLLDEDLSVVNRLGIASDLANPSTFIIDRLGQVRYSYVGKYTSDRPSIKAMLLQLDGLVGAEASLSNQNNSPGDASSRNVTPTSGDSRESASLNNASNTNRTG